LSIRGQGTCAPALNFASGVIDTVTYQAEATAYYEVEASNILPERKPLLHHHAHSIRKAHSPERKPLTNRLWHIREDVTRPC
jgi:hypothetical protein